MNTSLSFEIFFKKKMDNTNLIIIVTVVGVFVLVVLVVIFVLVFTQRDSYCTCSTVGRNGNLGNQMFQIASTIGIAEQVGTKYVFPDHLKELPIYRLYQLDSLPMMKDSRAVRVINEESPFHELSRFQLKGKKDSIDLKGYWQNPFYFDHSLPVIQKIFTFRPEIVYKTKSQLKVLSHPNVIGIHVRRGDYTTGGNETKYTQCGQDYYRKAIQWLLKRIDDTRFPIPVVLFSDEPQRLRQEEFLKEYDLHYSPFSDDPLLDFAAMASCTHLIMANSSFSWWAAWHLTNGEKNGIVVAPTPWYDPKGSLAYLNTTDMYLDSWIVLDVHTGKRIGVDYLNKVFDESVKGPVEIHPMIGPAFVVSLENQQQRLENALNLLKRLGVQGKHFKAFEAKNVDRKELRRKGIISRRNTLDTSGTIGCALSHETIWNYVVENQIPLCTVFEDDIHTYIDKSGFEERLKSMFSMIPKDWDMVFLGRCIDRCEKYKKLAPGIYQAFAPMCTHAYIISLQGATKLLSAGIYNGIDSVITDLCRKKQLLVYTFHPSIFLQDILEYSSTLRNFRAQIGNAVDCAYL